MNPIITSGGVFEVLNNLTSQSQSSVNARIVAQVTSILSAGTINISDLQTAPSGNLLLNIPLNATQNVAVQISGFAQNAQFQTLQIAFPDQQAVNLAAQNSSANLASSPNSNITLPATATVVTNAQGQPASGVSAQPQQVTLNLSLASQSNASAQTSTVIADSVSQTNLPSNISTNFTPNAQSPSSLPQNLLQNNTSPIAQFSSIATTLQTQNSSVVITPTNINLPNGSQINVAQPLPNAPTITGAFETLPNGTSQITTPAGNFKVDGGLNIPNGTQVTFQIVPGQQPVNVQTSAPQLGVSPQALAAFLGSEASPANTLVKYLQALPFGAAFLARFMPAPDDKSFAGRALSQIAQSAKGGESIYTEALSEVKNIDQNSTNMQSLKEVSKSLSGFISRQEFSNDGTVFNSYIIPYFDGQNAKNLSLYVEKYGDGKNSDGSQKQQRQFAMELEQEEMGKIEINGKFFPAKGRLSHIDLSINSLSQFSEEAQGDIRQLTTIVSEAFGFTSSVKFGSLSADRNLLDIINPGVVV